MTARRTSTNLSDFCEVCGRVLVSRKVRQRGRCGAHDHPLTLPLELPQPRRPKGGEER
jgi:hypothetical protein